MKFSFKKIGFIVSGLSLAVLMGCNSTTINNTKVDKESTLWDFEAGELSSEIKLYGADASIITEDNNKKLSVKLNSTNNYKSSFVFQPETPWDWSQQGPFAFALDIENPLDSSIHFYVTATDASGKTHNRSLSIPENSSDTYYLELAGSDLDIETGIRSNPKSWISDYTPIIWRWGVKKIDLKNIKSIEFKILGVLEDKQVVIDNVRLIKPEKIDENYLVGLVDEFGQNAKMDFIGKVHSVEELRQASAKEQSQLSTKPPVGRSKFNGWADGPKLKGTGYFRTEKVKGKWSLVDPEGYLFFSNGIANVRMANTSTITGYDFDSKYIEQRDPNDKTPEDSLGLNQAPKAAWSSRAVSSELRANMFSWLPNYEDELGVHFGYRREVFMGAIEKGETYSFYQANLARKYGSNDTNVFMDKWRDTTVDRMLSWGFTSFGNWVDPSFYQLNRIPYFANGWIIGDFKTLSSGNDLWSALPDVFDPVFKERALATAKHIGEEVQNNPWCVGVFIDNEKSWGMEGSTATVYGIPINTLSLNAAKSPTKSEFVKVLRKKYQTIEQLNSSWNIEVSSWDEFAKGIKVTEFNEALTADLSTLLTVYSEQYFKVVKGAVKQYLPNHLYMGARFADWGMTSEVRAAAAKYADVVSYNYYKEGISNNHWSFLAEIDKPSIIGEFHNGAVDSGLLNPGLIHASSQADRGKKYQEYMYGVIDNPYLVGAHWFQYIDSPLTGRAYDGENYNVGFVSVADIPYQPLVDAAKEVNSHIYSRRFGHLKTK
ncbi:beta-galactosidase [Colwellia sp. RE-S-Sl-9]